MGANSSSLGAAQANAGMRMTDSWRYPSVMSPDDVPANNQQQILHELLRQRSSGGNWDSKFPPNKQSDSSM